LGNGQKVTFKISKEDISKKSIGELRNRIQKQIKDQVLNKTDKATVGNILRKLKKQGFLKQGGKITDTQIDNFLKQYK
jgi:DNA-directed RNA polymerase specialized sigma54-like protein